jgi:hypothetical protein
MTKPAVYIKDITLYYSGVLKEGRTIPEMQVGCPPDRATRGYKRISVELDGETLFYDVPRNYPLEQVKSRILRSHEPRHHQFLTISGRRRHYKLTPQ